MKTEDTVAEAIAALPEPLQAPAARWFERFLAAHAPPAEQVIGSLARLVACSEFAGRTLLAEWGDVAADLEAGSFADPDFEARLAEAGFDDAKSLLRRERNRRLLGILAQDLGGTPIDATLAALSTLAEQMIAAAVDVAARRIRERHGRVRDGEGGAVGLVVIGMGKLGGGELNFSSDVDVIFAYPRDGESDGDKPLYAQQYFDRMSRYVVALLDEVTADGFVYRTDTRLRPFGVSGPPVVSFPALESYLQKHGRDWERYAYVKARVVGPAPPTDVVSELFDELVGPFVYRRYLDYGVFRSLRDMHALIASEVERRELADDVKRGPGGIREIEFIVQSLQLVRGGRDPRLRSPSLLDVLPKLVDSKGLGAGAADELGAAYWFLRRLENWMQAIRDKQTHTLPTDDADRARLALALGFDDWPALEEVLEEHRAAVSAQFDAVAIRSGEAPEEPAMLQRLAKRWDAGGDESAWAAELETLGFEDAARIANKIVSFAESNAVNRIDSASAERLRIFMPRLLALARKQRDPRRAVSRCLGVVEQVLRRSAYLALLNENHQAAERFVRLCERSAFIARELSRYPVLLDELLGPGTLERPLSSAELRQEFRERLDRHGPRDTEQVTELLTRFQRANLFRIAVADFTGRLPVMKVSDALTWLAEAVLGEALDLALGDLAAKHGIPRYELDGERHAAGFGIVAYGKLGGLELSYGSDLDIVFLHDSRGERQTTDGERPLENPVFFSRLVRRLTHILTTQTTTGALYEVDTRLRPSGRKGLLVTSVDAFERYQDENAWTWEHQALLRARPVAGSDEIADTFRRIRSRTLTERVRRETLREDVAGMRAKMRRELDRSDASGFDLKHGAGGIGDIEFIVQYLVLDYAGEHPAVIEFTDNIRQLDALRDCGILPADTAERLQTVYREYRQTQHHRVLNDEAPVVAAEDFTAERAFVRDCWASRFES